MGVQAINISKYFIEVNGWGQKNTLVFPSTDEKYFDPLPALPFIADLLPNYNYLDRLKQLLFSISKYCLTI
jgi:hypothetical protein